MQLFGSDTNFEIKWIQKDRIFYPKLSPEYFSEFANGFFFSAYTAERFFRIDRAQEQLHYVTDVAIDTLYVLEESSSHQGSQEPPSRNQSSTNQRLSRYV